MIEDATIGWDPRVIGLSQLEICQQAQEDLEEQHGVSRLDGVQDVFMNQLTSVEKYKKISEGAKLSNGKEDAKMKEGAAVFVVKIRSLECGFCRASLLGGLTQRDAEIREELSLTTPGIRTVQWIHQSQRKSNIDG